VNLFEKHKTALLTLRLPWPPSVNNYWRSMVMKGRVQVYLSKAGKAYRKAVDEAVFLQPGTSDPLTGPLSVTITAHAPTRRAYDLDNLPKGVLDGLGHANVYEDDSQIDDLRVFRGSVDPPAGHLDVRIQTL